MSAPTFSDGSTALSPADGVGEGAVRSFIENAPSITKRAPRRLSLAWAGVLPFAAITLLFLILPTLHIVLGAFATPAGDVTFGNFAKLITPALAGAVWLSIKISVVTAALGCLFGLLIAVALVHGGLPSWLRGPLLTFSGVAANFAGVPLAFAFIATLGRLGVVTVLARDWFGVNIYAAGFNLISFSGLVVTYLYFQIPLMVLIIMPAIDGLKKEWREAAESLGASGVQYWRMVAIPILWPSLLGTFALLFANAFGAVATAMALTGSTLSLMPIILFAQIRGDVLQNPHLGYALAFVMIVMTAFANVLYVVLRARAERWLK